MPNERTILLPKESRRQEQLLFTFGCIVARFIYKIEKLLENYKFEFWVYRIKSSRAIKTTAKKLWAMFLSKQQSKKKLFCWRWLMGRDETSLLWWWRHWHADDASYFSRSFDSVSGFDSIAFYVLKHFIQNSIPV